MKRIILSTLILLQGILLNAQSLDGTYENGSDSLVFNNDHIIFSVSEFGGLSTTQVGEGTYEIIDDFLLINTKEYSGDKSAYEEMDGSKTDTCVVRVVGLNNYAIQGVLVESKNSSNKTINAGVTGNDGRLLFLDDDKCVKFSTSAMGYNSIEFDYNSGKDYLIRLAENDVIENSTVVFRFEEIDDETVSILLLTDNFDTNKNRDRELKKLEKRARKNNRIDKRYKKKFEPYVNLY